jgi:hypothetical protein
MRKALQYLGLADLSMSGQQPTGLVLMVISCSFDRRALALGPQLAVFAAARGIPTALVVGPQQDISAAATLRAACAAPPHEPSSRLRVVVKDHADAAHEPDVALTVVVAVVDAEAPAGGHEIAGILVADPDPADTTTGRLPRVERPAHRRRPTRMTGTTRELGE